MHFPARTAIAVAALAVALACPLTASAQFATSEVSAPGSPSPFRVTKAGWTWEDLGAGVTYSVHRATSPPLGFTCILDRHATPSWTGDADPAPPGGLSHYLVTAFDGTVDNSPGTGSEGQARLLATPCPRPVACCFPDGSCQDLDIAACAPAGGTAQALDTTCATTPCVRPEACCFSDGSCQDLDAAACATAGGTSQGPGTTCLTTTCTLPCAAGTPVPGRVPLRLVSIGAAFSSPIFLTTPPGDPRLFILERAGRIRLQRPDGSRALFHDFSARVLTGSERGALGLAFHPDYATNGLFYVYYSTSTSATCAGDHCARLAEFRVSPGDPDLADAAYERVVLELGEPFGNHNGGWTAFGPDGMLYIAFGDGGSGGDPLEAGQDLGVLLGKILRLDVDGRDPGLEYAIPPDNPFVGSPGARAEIWSWGVRNPWRDSFDRGTGDLYIADVGQNRIEEVNVATVALGAGRGQNYGWDEMEGSSCYEPAAGCNTAGKVLPDWEYPHSDGCSITGGYVYRGCRLPDWQGWYFFADYCNEWIDSFNYELGVAATRERTFPGGSVRSPVSFGEDAEGELYVVSAGGNVYRIEP